MLRHEFCVCSQLSVSFQLLDRYSPRRVMTLSGKSLFVIALPLLGTIAPVSAQTWPTKPIRWISPFAPGGGADITSRVIAQKLGPALNQQILVDNRGGAG